MSKLATLSPRKKSPCADRLACTFDEVRDDLVHTLSYLLGNSEDAQDAAQDAFLKCWRAREQVDDVHNLRAWIFRVGLNAAKDLQRSAWRRRVRPLSPAAALEQRPGPSPVESAMSLEALRRLRAALVDLRAEEKEVFLLRQNGDLTYDEIADLTSRPVGTIKTQMRTALGKLRKVLQEREG